MKLLKLNTLSLLLALSTFVSCDDKDEIKPLSPEKEVFIGHWQLARITQEGTEYDAVNDSRIIFDRGGSSLGDGTYALNLYYRTIDKTVPYGYSNGGTWALKDTDKIVLNGDVDAQYQVKTITADALTIERHEKVVNAKGRFIMKHRENAINPYDSVHVMTESPVVYTFEKKK
ncbi:hypothetical protein AAE02nite_49940 [Adhaeribacter aerolatus]|uniref:Lipocalin-like domain-containing protein n=1 Tax=Adhaeribacter aerolatus TaxID=670289 RepID=A0A512B5U4_9BACT|nr:lipocalin family protein [Adhaeribacter aerolatus]GEO07330.1 hypothetical protein AAE02nite_49940 [Adhaeribacter aerolatus]